MQHPGEDEGPWRKEYYTSPRSGNSSERSRLLKLSQPARVGWGFPFGKRLCMFLSLPASRWLPLIARASGRWRGHSWLRGPFAGPLLRTGGAADRGWWFQGLQGQQSPRLCVVGCFFRLQALQEGALPSWGAFQSRDCGVYVHARGIDRLNVMGTSQRCGVAPTSAWISGPLIPADETMLRA